MGRMQRRLYNLGVFDKVDMAIQNPQGDTEHKYVVYHLTEGHRYYTAIGLGARGGAHRRQPDQPRQSGRRHRLRSHAALSNSAGSTFGASATASTSRAAIPGSTAALSLNYLAPRYRNVDGRNISLTALYDNSRDVLTFTARRLEGTVAAVPAILEGDHVPLALHLARRPRRHQHAQDRPAADPACFAARAHRA